MTQLAIDVTDGQIQAVLTQAANQLTDLTPVIASIGAYMLGRTRERLDTSTAPSGQREVGTFSTSNDRCQTTKEKWGNE
ncbi:hypothetical protein [Chamaesiphon sp.]|uniref:hypothetical protein n=1 Tax=Chamaesiphon sp. TaxID=2814140 RepID=UPI003593CE84